MYSVCTASLKLKLSQAGKSACAQHNHQLVKADDNFLAARRASDKTKSDPWCWRCLSGLHKTFTSKFDTLYNNMVSHGKDSLG